MTNRERVRRELELIRAMNADGALLTSEVRAAPCAVPREKKPPTAPAGENGRGAPGGGGAPRDGWGSLEA